MESASTPVIYRAYGYTRGTGIACCSTQIMILTVAAYDFIAEVFGPILWILSVTSPLWRIRFDACSGKATELVRSGSEETFSFEHWKRIRTNNGFERFLTLPWRNQNLAAKRLVRVNTVTVPFHYKALYCLSTDISVTAPYSNIQTATTSTSANIQIQKASTRESAPAASSQGST